MAGESLACDDDTISSRATGDLLKLHVRTTNNAPWPAERA